jgi:hypothetical protein
VVLKRAFVLDQENTGCGGQRDEENGREVVSLVPRHAVEDTGAEVAEGSRDTRAEIEDELNL